MGRYPIHTGPVCRQFSLIVSNQQEIESIAVMGLQVKSLSKINQNFANLCHHQIDHGLKPSGISSLQAMERGLVVEPIGPQNV